MKILHMKKKYKNISSETSAPHTVVIRAVKPYAYNVISGCSRGISDGRGAGPFAARDAIDVTAAVLQEFYPRSGGAGARQGDCHRPCDGNNLRCPVVEAQRV